MLILLLPHKHVLNIPVNLLVLRCSLNRPVKLYRIKVIILSLLDPSIEYYVLHEKTWKFGGGDIYNPQGEKIGFIKRKLISMCTEIELCDSDEKSLAVISRKIVSVRPIYDVKDSEGSFIGRAKKSLIAFRGSIDMYDSDNKIIYRAQGGVTKWEFRITAPDDKKRVFAEIKRGDKWRDVFGRAFSFKDRYVLHIANPDVPRLILLAYAIIIDNEYHHK